MHLLPLYVPYIALWARGANREWATSQRRQQASATEMTAALIAGHLRRPEGDRLLGCIRGIKRIVADSCPAGFGAKKAATGQVVRQDGFEQRLKFT